VRCFYSPRTDKKARFRSIFVKDTSRMEAIFQSIVKAESNVRTINPSFLYTLDGLSVRNKLVLTSQSLE
jgi:hypothetical protein